MRIQPTAPLYRRQHARAFPDGPAAAEKSRHEDDGADDDEQDGRQTQMVLIRDEILDVIVAELEENTQG